MFIKKVISYGNAWSDLFEHHGTELEEIRAAIARLTKENIELSPPIRDLPYQREPGLTLYRLEGCWDNAIRAFGWEEVKESIRNLGPRPIYMRGLGYIKNSVCVSLQRHREILNRWLYTLAPIGKRSGYIDIPVAIIMLTETEETLFGRRGMMRSGFERTQDELIALSPLSHSNPFLLLGISLDEEPLEIVELESEGGIYSREIVVDRSIEFPPEYHQAGLGILNYFGSVLREKYPGHNAKVRIEQDGLKVRLIIESENGDREIIEKALQEYEMVVRGESPPEAFFDSRTKVLELKNELRIAQLRIESQRDLIAYQGTELVTLKQIIGHILSKDRQQPLAITVSPIINVSNAQVNDFSLEYDMPAIVEHVQELAVLATSDPSLQLRLLDLEESLNAAGNKKTPDSVRESGGMQKLKRFLDEATETGSTVQRFVSKLTDGIGAVQKLARKYNEIAAWCGAPQVPQVLLGKES